MCPINVFFKILAANVFVFLLTFGYTHAMLLARVILECCIKICFGASWPPIPRHTHTYFSNGLRPSTITSPTRRTLTLLQKTGAPDPSFLEPPVVLGPGPGPGFLGFGPGVTLRAHAFGPLALVPCSGPVPLVLLGSWAQAPGPGLGLFLGSLFLGPLAWAFWLGWALGPRGPGLGPFGPCPQPRRYGLGPALGPWPSGLGPWPWPCNQAKGHLPQVLRPWTRTHEVRRLPP